MLAIVLFLQFSASILQFQFCWVWPSLNIIYSSKAMRTTNFCTMLSCGYKGFESGSPNGSTRYVNWISWHFLKQRYRMFMLEMEWAAVVLHLIMRKRTLQICKSYYFKRKFSFPVSVFRHTWMNSTSHSDNRHHSCVMTVFSALLISFCFLNAHIGYWINVCLCKSKLLHRGAFVVKICLRAREVGPAWTKFAA